MAKDFKNIYQFRIELRVIKPAIWRVIQVPENYSFWDLHVAIQDAMGWFDGHLHEFEMEGPIKGIRVNIGIPDEDFDDDRTLNEWEQPISKYISLENSKANYTYDFGDNWEHRIKLQKILTREENVTYPRCINGKRACPPEDCGGYWGYEEILQIIKDPNHEQYEETIEWLDGQYDPEHFEPDEVFFDDPADRLKFMQSI
ncbi:plasmid pRiA4b ORF-3 family protein [candidate division KSB1 bacterium]|nr:plasmid pRiA4b ORF-3 family protein [candidate division KSB1 bacterium]